MRKRKSEDYKPPRVTAYGSVETVTEEHNKYALGTDVDTHALNVNGSAAFH